MTDKGYGSILSNCTFKPDASCILMDQFALENDEILHEFYIFCENYGYSSTEAEAREDFVRSYEDDLVGYGMEGLLARVIDDAEFEGEEYFLYRDECIYVSAMIPVDEVDKQSMPTQKDIRTLLEKYLFPLLEAPAEVEWVDILD